MSAGTRGTRSGGRPRSSSGWVSQSSPSSRRRRSSSSTVSPRPITSARRRPCCFQLQNVSHDVADDAGVRSSDLCREGRAFRSRVCACIFSWFQTFRVLQFTIQIPYRTCVLTCLGIKREQGVPGDPAHQRDQVHHVAQRLLPVGDHPEEMVGSLALFCFPVAAHRPSDAVI